MKHVNSRWHWTSNLPFREYTSKQAPFFNNISWQRILYISCFTNIHTKTWRAIRITVQVLLYQAVASEQGCIVEKTLLIHRPVKTIGLMNPCKDEVLVMPYIAHLYKRHKKIIIILLWWQHLWASTGS